MTTMTICPLSNHVDLPCLNQVDWWEPLRWLKSGWHDFKANWMSSLAIGAVFSIVGFILTQIAWTHWYMSLTLTTGFLLLSPFLAIGFYELSRRGEGGVRVMSSPVENLGSIGLFAALLMFSLSAWERISAILVGLYLGPHHVPDASLTWLFSSNNWEFLIAYLPIGAILAALVFSLSVVSLPMMMDRKVDAVTAVVTSLYAVRLNPLAMAFWAAIIVVAVAIGIATAFIGLAVIFPILGHASWHAYRELIAVEG